MSMSKAHLNLSVDSDLLEEAQKKGFNISRLTNDAMRQSLKKTLILIDRTIETCEFCGKKEEKATNINPVGLTWIFPDERWICKSCLRDKSRKLSVSPDVHN